MGLRFLKGVFILAITIRLLYKGSTRDIQVRENDLYDAKANVVALLNLRYKGWQLDDTGFQTDNYEITRQNPDEAMITIDLDKYERKYASKHPYVVATSDNAQLDAVLETVQLVFYSKEYTFVIHTIL